MSKMYNPHEVAEQWGISETMVRKLLRDHKLGGVKIGTSWRIRQEDMDAYEAANRSEVIERPKSPEPVRRPVIAQIV